MDKKYWIWLLKIMLPHNPRSIQILNYYGGINGVYEAISGGDYSFLSENERCRIKVDSLSSAERIVSECENKGVRIVSIEDEDYPQNLKNIYNPPIVLFVLGDISIFREAVTLAVVGTRSHTPYGEKVGKKLSSDLAKLGVVLVSGFAVGLDSVAHRACIENDTPTAAVLACGIFVDYPSQNFPMRAEIIKKGVIISELLPYAEVKASYFHERNRIISGLGMGTLIVEAPKRSGCLITAEHTIQQGRDLFCVPPFDITSYKCAGVIPYLRDGAIPVYDYLDIVYQYYENFSHRLQFENMQDKYIDKSISLINSNDRQTSRKRNIIADNTQSESISKEYDFSFLDDTARTIAQTLLEKPMTLDELIDSLEFDHITVCASLTELEINGYAKLKYGGIYEII